VFHLLTHLGLSKPDRGVDYNDKIPADYGDRDGDTSQLDTSGIVKMTFITI
jgi:hypothetical protein